MLTPAAEPPLDVAHDHRRNHRMGVPAKIACDPELRAFVEARFATMTFKQIAEAVAAEFPKDRHVSFSSIYRWWRIVNGRPVR